MASIEFYHKNHNYVTFRGERDIIFELRNRYSFYAPNYKFHPKHKAGLWDGKISMINLKDSHFYAGLLQEIKQYLDEEGVEYSDNTQLVKGREITVEQVYDFYTKIKGPFRPHESQALSFQNCVSKGRNIILAPTSNGKSYIIHGLNAYYTAQKKRVLIVINRAQLVMQLKSNFVDEYGSDPLYLTSTIYDEDQTGDVVITTWQSVTDKDIKWFKQFDVLIADEVHTFKAKSLISLVDKCGHIAFRHGFTATLDNDSKTDAMTLEGMFGKPYQAITLREQIDQEISARPIIYAVILKYSPAERKALIDHIHQSVKKAQAKGKKGHASTIAFQAESKFLENHERRNQIIAQIAAVQKGNTLIAFKNHEHGKAIEECVRAKVKGDIFFVNSTVTKEKRFAIQKKIGELSQSVSIVSFGTFSTGINITNLNNLIIGSQVKSGITVPQLIGRMIRLCEGKTTANVIDICDDLSTSKGKNFFMNHFEKRMKFYIQNGFEVKVKTISVNG